MSKMVYKGNWQELEKDWLQWLISEADFNLERAARVSGLSSDGIRSKIKRHRLQDWFEQAVLDKRKKHRAKLYGDNYD